MKKPRHLSPEERALWDRVTERTTPMTPDMRGPTPLPPKPKVDPVPRDPLPAFRVGAKADHRRPNKLTAAAFGQRRKMLRGSLKPLGGEALLERAGITPTQRAEEISVEGFCALARCLDTDA